MTLASRLETWFSSAVTLSKVASEPASDAVGGTTSEALMPFVGEAGTGLAALTCTPFGTLGKSVVPEASVPDTSVPDTIVSAVLAASPPGA